MGPDAMTAPADGRAAALVKVQPKVPGGPWFIEVGPVDDAGLSLGPYENPAVARDEARRLTAFLDRLLDRPPGS